MKTYVNEYLDYLSGVRKLSDKTIESYKRDSQLFLKYIDKDPLSLTSDDLRILISQIASDRYEASSINRLLAFLRGYYTYLVSFKIIESNPASLIKNLKEASKLPTFLEHENALSFCKLPETLAYSSENPIDSEASIPDSIPIKPLWAARDVALLLSLYSTGCRVSEITHLKLQDFDSKKNSAIVKGKGSKERNVFFSKEARKSMLEYLIEREAVLKTVQSKNNTNFVFISQKGNPLSVRGVQYILKHYAQSKLGTQNISPHSLRHSFATTMVTKGADIRIVQEMLGHENISTTQKYTHVTPQRLRALYHQAHPHG